MMKVSGQLSEFLLGIIFSHLQNLVREGEEILNMLKSHFHAFQHIYMKGDVESATLEYYQLLLLSFLLLYINYRRKCSVFSHIATTTATTMF